jgi:hypothetical protein
VVRSCGPATQNTKRSFPRSYNRTHISKWLIAENSGKCLEELDVLVGTQSILASLVSVVLCCVCVCVCVRERERERERERGRGGEREIEKERERESGSAH